MRLDKALVWQFRSPGDPEWLSATEQQRLSRFTNDRAAHEYLLGATGLRRAVGDVLRITPASVPVDRTCVRCGGPHGRPLIDGVQVSVAHAGGIALVAVSDQPVGIDLEPVGRDVPPGCGAVDLVDWVRKEAVLKLAGVGLRAPMAEVVISGDMVQSWPLDPLPALRIHDLTIPGFVAALAADPDAAVIARW